jgi:hypothetical protein
MIFAGTDAVGRDGNTNLWVTDGTAAGTKELIVPGALSGGGLFWKGEIEDPEITVFGSKALLAGLNNNFSLALIDLWVTDGTASGTKDLRVPGVGFDGLAPSHITTFGSKAIFAGFDSVSVIPSPWVTDGTLGGTHELVPPGSGILGTGIDPDFTVLGNKVLFVAQDLTVDTLQLWVTDGTPTGTKELSIVNPHFFHLFDDRMNPDFTVIGDKVFFDGIAEIGDSTQASFWITDGTVAGTKALTIVGADPNGIFDTTHVDKFSHPVNPDFTVLGKKVLFQGWDAGDHLNLWVTNGTAAGTKELTGANPDGLFSLDASPPDFTVLGGKVLFAGVDAKLRDNLWVTDGTSAGTKELAVANANSFGLFNPVTPHFAVLGNLVLFEGTDAKGSVGLWVTDGTSSGTHELKVAHANPDGLFNPALVSPEIRGFAPDFTALGRQAVFEGFDDGGKANLWITNGTSTGTRELMPAASVGPFGLDPRAFTVIPNTPPSGLALASGSDSGVKGDRITNVTKPVITGKGVAGDTVTLRDGTKIIGTAKVTAGGTWSVTPTGPLAAGVHTLTATESSAVLGVSAASAALKLTIKVSAPAPSGLSFAVAADKGALGDTMIVAGRGEAGDTVTLFDGAKVVRAAKVAAGGAWSITTAKPLAIGAHSLSASEVDVAANKSAASPAQSLTLLRATPNRAVFVGTTGKDLFTGGAGSDVFKFTASALAASDVVRGGAGADYLTLTSAGTVHAGGVAGVETWYLAGTAANSLTLANANFAGTAGATITVVGGAKGNRLSEAAVSAADRAILKGGAGADTLVAGRHAALTGGGDSDRFELTTPGSTAVPDRNTIADFKHGADKLGLAETGFGLGSAPSAATLFRSNPTGAFTSAAQRFAYDTATGVLRFDADGKGGGSSPLTIATLTGHPSLTPGDLFFFAAASG